MSELVGNPEDRFPRVAARMMSGRIITNFYFDSAALVLFL